jgi:hypothetical protein
MVKEHNRSRPIMARSTSKQLIPASAMLKPAANARGRANSAKTHRLTEHASARFDWDKALYLHALAMWSLGYELSAQQKRRIENHA